MTVLAVSGLGVAIAGRNLVRDVSFTVDAGETLAIVGESGSGKSLTALSILNLLPAGAVRTGCITVDGVDIEPAATTGTSPALRRLRGGTAGMVFQEPMTSLNPLHRIGRQVAEAAALHGPAPTRGALLTMLARAGFADAESRLDAFPHQLSGGQRQRVMIAMALANNPRLLIADEPTTALDVTIQAQILDLLAAEKAARGLAMLIISHDLNLVRRVADRVCVMQDGTIVEQGPVRTLLVTPRHAYTRMLIDAEPSGRPSPVPADAVPVIAAQDLRVSFPIRRGVWRRTVGHVAAVDGVDLSIRAGETLALVGESGSGKSTIGLALLRLQPSTGRIVLLGQDITRLRQTALRPLRRTMQVVFQDPYGSLSPRMSMGDIVAEGLRVHEPSMGAAARDRRVAAALAEVDLPPDTAGRFPHEFSGGQRQRVAIARALILAPSLLILDEPTSALDRSVQAQVVDLLRTLQVRHGLAYLFISHDLAVARALAHRVMVLRHGRVVEEGDAAQVFRAPRAAYTKALLHAAAPDGVVDALADPAWERPR